MTALGGPDAQSDYADYRREGMSHAVALRTVQACSGEDAAEVGAGSS